MESEVATRELPILFNGEMVRAIREGRKTQTRRVIKPQLESQLIFCEQLGFSAWEDPGLNLDEGRQRCCPFGVVGDRLWVRETWGSLEADHPRCQNGRKPQEGDTIVYRANPADDYQWGAGKPSQGSFVWRPSIHMPRWASRLAPVVTDVRVQRVQEISEEDALAEGVMCEFYDGSEPISSCYWDYESKMWSGAFPKGEEARGSFRTLWDSINKKRNFGWEVNPTVWAVTFKVEVE